MVEKREVWTCIVKGGEGKGLRFGFVWPVVVPGVSKAREELLSPLSPRVSPRTMKHVSHMHTMKMA
jgi:hypothetical protein